MKSIKVFNLGCCFLKYSYDPEAEVSQNESRAPKIVNMNSAIKSFI